MLTSKLRKNRRTRLRNCKSENASTQNDFSFWYIPILSSEMFTNFSTRECTNHKVIEIHNAYNLI